MRRKRLLLLPVNNNDDPSAQGGGSHWSLLVYRPTRRLLHLDSRGASNEHWAQLARFAYNTSIDYFPIPFSFHSFSDFDIT